MIGKLNPMLPFQSIQQQNMSHTQRDRLHEGYKNTLLVKPQGAHTRLVDRYVWIKLARAHACVISCRTSDCWSLRHIWQSSPPFPPFPPRNKELYQHSLVRVLKVTHRNTLFTGSKVESPSSRYSSFVPIHNAQSTRRWINSHRSCVRG